MKIIMIIPLSITIWKTSSTKRIEPNSMDRTRRKGNSTCLMNSFSSSMSRALGNSMTRHFMYLSIRYRQKIQTWAYNREKQNYFYFVEPEKFVQFSKNERMERFMQKNSELVTEMLLEKMGSREYRIETDILEGVLEISDKPRQVKLKDRSKQEQPNNNIKQLSQQQLKQQQQQIRRKYKEVVENQKKQKERLQRLRQLEYKQKKQLHQKLKAQQSLQKQQMKKYHSQLISQKISDSLKKRQQQKKQRLQRQKDYNYIVKSWANGQILHQKMQRQFRRRYQQINEQDRQRVQSQRSKLMMNAKVEDLNIKQHEQKYLKWRQENAGVRASKMEEHERMIEAFERELKRLANGKNKDKDNCDEQEDDQQRSSSRKKFTAENDYHKVRERQRLAALQRRQKMQNYWSSFVKEDFQPTIDQRKRQELQQLITSLQSAHKMKKVKDEKGEYRYEELKLVDPALKGIEYLQYSRQIGRRKKEASGSKRKDSVDDKESIHSMHSQNQQRKRKSVDYLKQLRQSRSNSLNTSHSKLNKLSFLQKPDLTFHQKLSRVQRETFKLQQATKLSENQLKYGKFKTSEEILQYKEEIDNNHVEILKMKLKLVQKAGNTGH